MYLSDPPYGVAYQGGTKDHLTIVNDNLKDGPFIEFLTHAFKAVDNVLIPGGAFYIWHSDGRSYVFRHACRQMGWEVKQCLIWVKNHFSLGRQDYQWIHEPCLYGWKDGAAHFFIDDRTLSTVFKDKPIDITKLKKEELVSIVQELYSDKVQKSVIYEDKPLVSAEHPTMKPIRLLVQLIQNSSRLGDTVLDTFGGSGSTLIACEETGRKCRMMELEPLYCDVIVERWEKLTGKKAELIND